MSVSRRGQDKGRQCESGSAKRKQKNKKKKKKPGACQPPPLPLRTLPRGDAKDLDSESFTSFPAASAECRRGEIISAYSVLATSPRRGSPRTQHVHATPPLHFALSTLPSPIFRLTSLVLSPDKRQQAMSNVEARSCTEIS